MDEAKIAAKKIVSCFSNRNCNHLLEVATKIWLYHVRELFSIVLQKQCYIHENINKRIPEVCKKLTFV